MIEYQAETWCLLVTHSSSHVRLTLLGIPSLTFGLCIIIIMKSIDYCNRINCIHFLIFYYSRVFLTTIPLYLIPVLQQLLEGIDVKEMYFISRC
jgi:hypothetical protein